MKKFVLLVLLVVLSVFAGSPKLYYISIEDQWDGVYDFTKFPYDNVTFEFWISGREYDICDQNGIMCGYDDFDMGISAIYLDLQNFQETWNFNDILNIRIKQDDNPFDTLWFEAVLAETLDGTADPVFIGFTDDPIALGLIAGGSDISTITYPCVTTPASDINLVGLPFDNGWTKASNFDPSGTNMDAVSHWSAEHQGWYTAGHHPSLGWGTDFEVGTGNAYMINALNNFDFTVTGQYVKEDYDLFPTAGTDINMVLHPVFKYQLDSLSEIGDDIGTDYLSTLSKWDNINQHWISTAYNVIIGWFGDQFSQAGDGLILNMKDSINWPGSKNTVKGGGIPRVAYFNLVNVSTGKALTYDEYRLIEFDAWIDQRPSEILHEYSYGCGFTMIDTLSVAYVEVSNFTSGWDPGEYLNIRFTNFDSMWGWEILDNYLDGSGSPLYIGFEPIIPRSGLPGLISMDHVIPICSVDLNIECEIFSSVALLSWGFNGYSIFHVYTSDTPYGEFILAGTVEHQYEWSEPIAEDKKFYHVRSSSGDSEPPKTIYISVDGEVSE